MTTYRQGGESTKTKERRSRPIDFSISMLSRKKLWLLFSLSRRSSISKII